MTIRKYFKYTSQFKHSVLEEYRPGVIGRGFKSLAKRFKVKGGHRVIMHWYKRWDGTIYSLNPQPKGHRPRTMTPQGVDQYNLEFVKSMNRKRTQVNYKIVQAHIESQFDRKVQYVLFDDMENHVVLDGGKPERLHHVMARIHPNNNQFIFLSMCHVYTFSMTKIIGRKSSNSENH